MKFSHFALLAAVFLLASCAKEKEAKKEQPMRASVGNIHFDQSANASERGAIVAAIEHLAENRMVNADNRLLSLLNVNSADGLTVQAWLEERIQMVADGIGLQLDGIETRFSRVLATRDLDVAAGLISKGSIAGQRWEWAGMRGGKKRIVHETIWRVHDSIGEHWPRGNHSIAIKGQPNMYLEFGHNWNDDPGSTTSMHAVNSVPYVCAAPSGIQTFLDLPWIMGRGSAHR